MPQRISLYEATSFCSVHGRDGDDVRKHQAASHPSLHSRTVVLVLTQSVDITAVDVSCARGNNFIGFIKVSGSALLQFRSEVKVQSAETLNEETLTTSGVISCSVFFPLKA